MGGWKRGNVPWGSERRFSSAVSMVSSGGGRSGRVNVEEIFILRVRNERKKEKWVLFEVGNASKNLNGLDGVGFLSKVY